MNLKVNNKICLESREVGYGIKNGGGNMGYISMIPLNQYQEYSKRVEYASKRQIPIVVNEVERIDITSKFHQMLEERIHAPVYKELEGGRKNREKGIQRMDAITYYTSKITGKGLNFNEYA